MNKINILQYDINGIKPFTINLDSFPTYPGFPKHISGTTFEGSIFCNMDSDPDLEIVFNVAYTVQAFNIDGSNVTGWPKTVSSYGLEGSPAFGDIDGDGYGEIVVTNHGLTSGGYIYAYKRDGTVCTGFPINHGYSSRSPVLADVNNDGKMEIIVNLKSPARCYIYKGDGTVLTGWPKTIGSVPASSAAVGDIDGDNAPEIIMEAYYGLYAWKVNGDSIPGFPFMMPNGDVNSYSSPVLADVNGDGYREIIFGTHSSAGGNVYVLKRDGTVQTGWPKTTGNWIYGPPSVGYIDNDNFLDIAIGDQIASMTPSDFVYAWDRNGNALTGFPIGPFNAINCQIVLADIDGDNLTELVFDDNTYSTTTGLGQYLAYNHDGTPVTGWPLNTTGTTFFTTPCFTDVNNNGTLDMIGAGIEGTSPNQYTNIYLWNTGQVYHPTKNYNRMWQYNTRHNGVYGDTLTLVGISTSPNTNTPDKFELMQNYPNPFNPTTNIKYQLGNNSFVSLKVYDILGKEVATLINEYKKAGTYEVRFDGKNLSSGIYLYKINAGDFSETKMMSLVK
ncbi:MAG: T9SS type A sorting domain-containing protein [Ignavibacteriae bacterium]|nr:T9SS type A sorting domain-containing protein [Ignavibacteriota bacterium]